MSTREPHEAVRYLGAMVTDTTWWGEAEKVAAERARRGAGKMRQVKVQSNYSAGMQAWGVIRPQIAYALRFTSVSEDELIRIMAPLEGATKQALTLRRDDVDRR